MPKYKTIAIDSAGELARLFFSYVIGKHAGQMEEKNIRMMNHYPGTTERMNILVRRLKNFRDAGMEVVFTAHEDIEKVYAKGSGMAAKGQPPPEPIAVKGWPDLPGKRGPDEFCRACDNVLRVRYLNGKPAWIGRREPIGPGAEYWEVKDRFNAPAIMSGCLPPSYEDLAKLAKANSLCNWDPPYLWMFYGPYGIGKTRSLITFPSPIMLFDLDKGSKSLTAKEITDHQITINKSFDPEEGDHYNSFVGALEACLV